MTKKYTSSEGPSIPEDRNPTKFERLADARFRYALDEQKRDLEDFLTARKMVPAQWYEMQKITPVTPKRKRITLLVDEEVIKWFKSLGSGYQARINAVLSSYMLGVTAKALTGEFDRDRKGELI